MTVDDRLDLSLYLNVSAIELDYFYLSPFDEHVIRFLLLLVVLWTQSAMKYDDIQSSFNG